MQIGVDSFVSTSKRGAVGDAQRVQDLLEEIELAEQVGLAAFGSTFILIAPFFFDKRLKEWEGGASSA